MHVKAYSGNHVFLYSNDHVNDVSITNQTTYFIANGIGKLFENLKQLEIMSSQLKFVNRRNFRGMKKLLDLRLDHNDIKIISAETFSDLTNLEWLSLTDNKLKVLSEGLTMKMLNLLWFTANENEIEIFEGKHFERNTKLELISIRANKIRKINFEIKKFNQIAFLDFRDNFCINDYFSKHEKTSSINELQTKIYNCSLLK